jgi:hypothetical protein
VLSQTKTAQTLPGDATQADALQRILSIGLVGAGAGASARSLIGLRDMFARPYNTRPKPQRPAVVEVNVPEAPEDQIPTRSFARSLRPKLAQEVPGILDVAGRLAGRAVTALTPSQASVGNVLSGRTHSDITAKPWFWPAAFAAGAGGLYGGHKAIDSVLGGAHQHDREEELERAKTDYRKALIEQYAPDAVKVGSQETNELGTVLDTLYELYKSAQDDGTSTSWNAAGHALGGYGVVASLLAGGTGLATYNWAKSRTPEERLAKAIQQRERLRWATRPPEIYAVAKPTPVRVSSQATGQTAFAPGSEEDEETVRKVATAASIATAAEIAKLYKPRR